MNAAHGGKTKGQQLVALKLQINFRKNILQQKNCSDLFAFSANRQPFPVEKLKANLTKLMDTHCGQGTGNSVEQVLGDPASLAGRKLTDLWRDEKGEIWWQGHVHSRVDNTDEFRVHHTHNPQDKPLDVYVELSDLIADIRSGDLKLL